LTSRTLRAAAVAFLFALAAACPGPGPEGGPTPPPSLAVSPPTAAFAPGDPPLTFTATLTGSTAAVAWSVVAGTCASPGVIGATTGLYTPPATNDAACTFKVRAAAGALTADAAVTLSARSATGDTLTVTPAAGRVRAGSATPLTIYVDASDAVTTPSCTLAPALGTCVEAADPAGHTHAFEVTAPATLVKVTTPVRASITVGALSAVATVTVDPSILLVSGAGTVRAGGGSATYVVGAPDVSGETVAWSLEPAAGTISSTGIYSPPATQVVATFDVVATIGEARGALSVTLQPPATTGGTASEGFLAMGSALDAKASECLGAPVFAPGELDATAASLQAAVDAGRVTYYAFAQPGCLSSIESQTCLALLRGADLPGCMEDVFAGTVAEAGECGDSVECAAGYCTFATGTCPGACAPPVAQDGACEADEQCATGLSCLYSTCRSPTYVTGGASCNGTTYVCFGSYCNGSTCVARKSAGDPCTETEACEPPLICNAATSTCGTYAARGQPCGASAGCNPFTDYCGSGGTCVAWPLLGEPCAVAGACHGDAWCDEALAAPICVAYPALGEACFAAGGTCAGEHYCDFSGTTPVCVPTKSSGECWYPGECVASMYCSGTFMAPGTCVPLIAAGGGCTPSESNPQCQPGLDCIGGICSVASCY
jgi:hypothetical protein